MSNSDKIGRTIVATICILASVFFLGTRCRLPSARSDAFIDINDCISSLLALDLAAP